MNGPFQLQGTHCMTGRTRQLRKQMQHLIKCCMYCHTLFYRKVVSHTCLHTQFVACDSYQEPCSALQLMFDVAI